jgi:3alpha(or 20beta)-hydroxysteroid dehydrogenase
MGRLAGKVALVSGGARGMGAEHAEMLTREGASVVVGDVLESEGKDLAGRLGDGATFARLDVTQEHDWDDAIQAAEDNYGPLDLLVNNAGILAQGTVADMAPADFRHVLDVNLYGTFLGMHKAVPSLRKNGGGVIVNISSTAGMMGYSHIGAYVASKWGIRGLTKTAALELGQEGIRVMSIHPGPITTPMTHGMDDSIAQTQPIPRMGTTDEVSKLLLFVVADATYSTGSEFVIDGGALLGPVIDLSSLDV